MERSRRIAGRRKRRYELIRVNPGLILLNMGDKGKKSKGRKEAKARVKVCFKNLGGR